MHREGIKKSIHGKACAMQTTNTYLGLLRERGKRGLPLRRVYRQLFNKHLYLTAYGKIYRNAGATTKGVNKETVDAMSLEKMDAIIEALRTEQYHWRPARRVYILKRNGKKRPLGLPVWSDKLLAEVIRLILNAYYDVQFSDHAHGFREGRGCHTALQEIYHTWGSATWIIEGDISDCFGSLPHNLILSVLSEKIHDGRFLHLMKKLLDAGYLEDWKFNRTLSGVPQGSIVSPILSNILLDKLDTFVETVLIPQYTRGAKRKLNQEYVKLHRQMQKDTKQRRTKAGFKRRSINGKVGLRVPRAVVTEKRKRYQQRGKPIHRAELLHESDYTIIATYQLEYRGIVNYYRHAYNLHRLHTLKKAMEGSLTKTLAAKHKISVGTIYKNYRAQLEVDGKTYQGLQVTIAREGKKPLVATWGGIPLKWDIKAPLDDQPGQIWHDRSELEQRLLAQTCEHCGATHITDHLAA